MRGGKRANAGRKRGSMTRRSQEVAAACAETGLMPLEFLLGVMRDDRADLAMRFDAAKAAAPYCHPRLSSQRVEVASGSSIEDWLDRIGEPDAAPKADA